MNASRIASRALALLALLSAPAFAATVTFLYIPGVPGESVDDRHPDWIDVQSVSVGVTGGLCDGFTVQKHLDKASPLLSAAALNRMIYPNVILETLKVGGGVSANFLTYSLDAVSVYSVTVRQSPTELVEVLVLRPAQVTTSYRQQDDKGNLGQATTSTIACRYGK